jgi:hypothetical protein
MSWEYSYIQLYILVHGIGRFGEGVSQGRSGIECVMQQSFSQPHVGLILASEDAQSPICCGC